MVENSLNPGIKEAKSWEIEHIIEDATPADAVQIARIEEHSRIAIFTHPETGVYVDDIKPRFHKDLQEIRKELRDSSHKFMVARKAGIIVGFVAAQKGEDENRIHQLHIIPSSQSQGGGQRLLERALDWLGDEKDIKLHVAAHNTRAQNLYAKFGFSRTSRLIQPFSNNKFVQILEMTKPASQRPPAA